MDRLSRSATAVILCFWWHCFRHSAMAGAAWGSHGVVLCCAAGTFLVIVQLLEMAAAQGGLQVGFYDQACPLAEQIVRTAVERGVQQDHGNAPGLIRLHFHDCFVRVCVSSL